MVNVLLDVYEESEKSLDSIELLNSQNRKEFISLFEKFKWFGGMLSRDGSPFDKENYNKKLEQYTQKYVLSMWDTKDEIVTTLSDVLDGVITKILIKSGSWKILSESINEKFNITPENTNEEIDNKIADYFKNDRVSTIFNDFYLSEDDKETFNQLRVIHEIVPLNVSQERIRKALWSMLWPMFNDVDSRIRKKDNK